MLRRGVVPRATRARPPVHQQPQAAGAVTPSCGGPAAMAACQGVRLVTRTHRHLSRAAASAVQAAGLLPLGAGQRASVAACRGTTTSANAARGRGTSRPCSPWPGVGSACCGPSWVTTGPSLLSRRPSPPLLDQVNEGVRDARCARTLTGTRPSARCLTPARRSGPGAAMLAAFVAARHGARLAGRPSDPSDPASPGQDRVAPGRCRRRSAWTRSPQCCWTAVVPACRPGRSGSARRRSATAWTCCLVRWPTSGCANLVRPS
jgi:hypothetical protein